MKVWRDFFNEESPMSLKITFEVLILSDFLLESNLETMVAAPSFKFVIFL